MRSAVVIALVAVASLGLAACGDSPEDEARKAGERMGAAVRDLYDAQSPEEFQSAAADVRSAREALGKEVRDHVQNDLKTSGDNISELANSVQAAVASGSVEQAQHDLQEAAQDFRQQAESLQSQDDAIANEFWRGFSDGFED